MASKIITSLCALVLASSVKIPTIHNEGIPEPNLFFTFDMGHTYVDKNDSLVDGRETLVEVFEDIGGVRITRYSFRGEAWAYGIIPLGNEAPYTMVDSNCQEEPKGRFDTVYPSGSDFSLPGCWQD